LALPTITAASSTSTPTLPPPLTDLLRKDQLFTWDIECQFAFEYLKRVFSTAPILCIFDPNLPTRTEHDASDYTLGSLLSQKHPDGHWHSVAFESHKFNKHECNYNVCNKEFRAITHCLKVWRHYLLGMPFELFVDHTTLATIPTQTHLNPHQAKAIELLTEYDANIIYQPGKLNALADALS
jgi:hypothetical protein